MSLAKTKGDFRPSREEIADFLEVIARDRTILEIFEIELESKNNRFKSCINSKRYLEYAIEELRKRED